MDCELQPFAAMVATLVERRVQLEQPEPEDAAAGDSLIATLRTTLAREGPCTAAQLGARINRHSHQVGALLRHDVATGRVRCWRADGRTRALLYELDRHYAARRTEAA
jgi:hypothetical protein